MLNIYLLVIVIQLYWNADGRNIPWSLNVFFFQKLHTYRYYIFQLKSDPMLPPKIYVPLE